MDRVIYYFIIGKLFQTFPGHHYRISYRVQTYNCSYVCAGGTLDGITWTFSMYLKTNCNPGSVRQKFALMRRLCLQCFTLFYECALSCHDDYRAWLTCFADPIHVSVHFSFQFLFLLEKKEAGSTLHAIFLFGELSRQRVQQQKVDNRMMEQ